MTTSLAEWPHYKNEVKNLNRKTLVIITMAEKYLVFRTVTMDRKSPHSFMISKAAIDDLYDLPRTVLCEHDCGSFAQIWRNPLKETVHIRFYWLNSNGFQLTGWEQTIIVPFDELMSFNKGYMGQRWALLSLEESRQPKLVFCGKKNLHAAVNDPTVRHKLTRFLRDNFRWLGADEILLYDDMEPYSFFFREMRSGRAGICGGVILHGHANMEKAQYSIHT